MTVRRERDQLAGLTVHWLRNLGSLQGAERAFDTVRVPDEPESLFLEWIHDAVHAGVAEPHAATLATIGVDHIPDARTLLLKDVTDKGWAVAGPKSSRKAVQLSAAPVAALNFWWQPIMRAVRVRGTVAAATNEEIAADLAARPIRAMGPSDDWMRWWIEPVRVEFWQGAVNRQHTRLVYEAEHGVWAHHTGDEGPQANKQEDDHR